MQPSSSQIAEFREAVWAYYRENGREMPWRTDPIPYKVLVSELMLQQTQVSRVIPKFEAFLYTCPNIADLAALPLSDVLTLWSGLGYNRRAKYLHHTAQIVTRDHGGRLPDSIERLMQLPGIGKNTAGAIMAYAYNQPVVFVETNIRTVYFHHFYPDHEQAVSDKVLEQLVELTLDVENPREWYWALMDYGAYLKKTAGGRLNLSRHYVKQKPLKGSIREMRGRIVKALTEGGLTAVHLQERVLADERFDQALWSLETDGLVVNDAGHISLTGSKQTS